MSYNSYNSLNFQKFFGNSEFFKLKFKREPKVWTIEGVHDLYLKALDRHNKRLKLWIDCVNRIVNETHEFEKDKRKIFFTKDGKIYQRVLNKNLEYNSWGVCSPDLVKFSSNSTIVDRNEKLEFLLSNEKAFELGELYESLQGNTRHLHLRVKQVLSEMVQDKLREKFKNTESPNMLTILIGEKRYYVVCDDQYRRSRIYKKFELLNEVTEEIKL
jgi:hypothetical protein